LEILPVQEFMDVEAETENELVSQRNYTAGDNYIDNIEILINDIREIISEGKELAMRFEEGEAGIRDMDIFINNYIGTIKNINSSYEHMQVPHYAHDIHQNFGRALDYLLLSVDYLEKYLETSIFSLDQKIIYVENAYNKILQAELAINNTEQKIDEHINN